MNCGCNFYWAQLVRKFIARMFSCIWDKIEYTLIRYFSRLLAYDVKCHFQQYFSDMVAISFIGGESPSTRRKPTTCRKSLTNFIT